jgi:hypothetical protein
MYKIHKPHLDSEYISDIRYVKTVDAEGAPDWEMCYVPGRRARAHFVFFKRNIPESSAAGNTTVEVAPMPGIKPGRSRTKKTAEPSSPEAKALRDRGVSPTVAEELSRSRGDDPSLVDVLEWGDQLIGNARPGTFRNPAGFYIYLVREGIKPPSGFATRLRAAREAEQAKQEERRLEQWRLEQAYEEYVQRETTKYISENVTETQLASLKAQKKQDLKSQFRSMTSEQIDALAQQTVFGEIRRSVPVKDFGQFCRDRAQSQTQLFLINS